MNTVWRPSMRMKLACRVRLGLKALLRWSMLIPSIEDASKACGDVCRAGMWSTSGNKQCQDRTARQS